MAHDREVLCGVARANSAVVFAKHDIEDPMQFVLNPPVLASRLQRRFGRAGVAGGLPFGQSGPDFASAGDVP